MESIHSILKYLSETGKKSVLATIIDVDGSAYLKEGSLQLFSEDEKQIGMISAGCLEQDIAARAKEMMLNGQMQQTIEYDLSDEEESGWGRGAGCNGTLLVSLELVNERLRDELMVLQKDLANGHSVMHTKCFSINHELKEYSFDIVSDDAMIQSHLLKKTGFDSSSYIYRQIFHPKPRLILFGGGRDAEPLCALASACGFSIWIVDWRPARLVRSNFPAANRLLELLPEQIPGNICFKESDYVVIMTHFYRFDQQVINHALGAGVKYVGILGSRDRTQKLLEGREIPKNLYAPIGLKIGAKGPAEIAISIMGEIIDVSRRKGERREAENGKDDWSAPGGRKEQQDGQKQAGDEA
ncbi:XdhC family protein [Falsibacillus albus]|uniref:XdhC family protein n=1 Tax=Falsibacillus albus TaxID=2478915 RepID=A0A3L7JYC6_9BACI|nr:XdhC family protein [Falsibacillus albus]RLQ95530.1 XdhC family protein [Falsibacillus albus]